MCLFYKNAKNRVCVAFVCALGARKYAKRGGVMVEAKGELIVSTY